MYELKVNKLNVEIKKKNIVDHISFNLTSGEWLAIVGENGAGKSSLVKAIIQLKENQKKYDGSILLNNKQITREIVKNQISYIAQINKAIKGITVEEYVSLAFYATSSAFSKKTSEDKMKIKKAIAKVGLKKYSSRMLSGLSGGELQKANLALGLVYEKDIIILDEPTNHLDLKSKREICRIMQTLHQKNKIVIWVTHDVNQAATHADKMMFLKNGQLLAMGTPKDVMTKSVIKKVFDVESEIKIIKNRPQIVSHK